MVKVILAMAVRYIKKWIRLFLLSLKESKVKELHEEVNNLTEEIRYEKRDVDSRTDDFLARYDRFKGGSEE